MDIGSVVITRCITFTADKRISHIILLLTIPGGLLTLNPESNSYSLDLYTDNRTNFVFYAGGDLTYGDDLTSRSIYTQAEIKVTPTLTLTIGPELLKNVYNAQYNGAYSNPFATETVICSHNQIKRHLLLIKEQIGLLIPD